MKAKTLWRISVATSPDAEDAVLECLAGVLKQPASSYTDSETGRITASVYLSKRSGFSKSTRAELLSGLRRIRACGLPLGRVVVRVERIPGRDWAEAWKHHFKPIEIGRALLLKPSWSPKRPRRGQALVTLDPGLSFGTGQHPTTRFCLEQLVAARKPDTAPSLLDIGTGSGILAISAAKLGYGPISAFDNDPNAVRISDENARTNGVRRQLLLRCIDLNRFAARQHGPFDVVCANLIFDLLLTEWRRILACLAPLGRLVLAGILHSQFPQVRRAYERAGMKVVAHKHDGEWESAAFVRQSGE